MIAIPATVLLLLCPAAGQGGEGPGGRQAVIYDGGSVSWSDFYLELARRHRGKQLGKNALDHLVNKLIVELEAKKRELDVPGSEVDKRLALVEKQLKAQGKGSLAAFLAKRWMTIDEFREMSRLSLLNEKLTRKDLGLGPTDRITSSQYALWSKEMQGRYAVVTDANSLPADTAARLKDHTITLMELGGEMARNLNAKDRRSILQQMAAYRLLRREAKKLGVEVTAANIEAEVAKRRALFARDPKFKGVTLEDFLHLQGRTLSDFENGEAFRAQLYVSLIGEHKFSTAKLESEYTTNPSLWAGRVGVSRRVFRIVFRVTKDRNADQTRDLCNKIAAKIKDLKTFQLYAQRLSEDLVTAKRAGDIGDLHRNQPHYSEALLSAAFALPVGRVSQPIVEPDVVSLLFVTEVKPAPKGKELIAAMRRFSMATWLEELVRSNNVRFMTN